MLIHIIASLPYHTLPTDRLITFHQSIVGLPVIPALCRHGYAASYPIKQKNQLNAVAGYNHIRVAVTYLIENDKVTWEQATSPPSRRRMDSSAACASHGQPCCRQVQALIGKYATSTLVHHIVPITYSTIGRHIPPPKQFSIQWGSEAP